MTELLGSAGLPGLFVLSFLAATLLPLGSEWLLAALILDGWEPFWPVAVATAGNTFGACTTYLIGLFGAPFLLGRLLRIDESDRVRAERLYTRLGSWSLLLSWLPIIGDPLCLAGGLLRISFSRFLLFVFAGKLARYAAVALLAREGSRFL